MKIVQGFITLVLL